MFLIWWRRCIKRKFLPVDFFPSSKKAFKFLIDHFWGVRKTLMEHSFLFVELLDANVGALHSISALTLFIRSFMYLTFYLFILFLYPFRFVLLVCACVCMCCYTSFFIHLTFESSMAVCIEANTIECILFSFEFERNKNHTSIISTSNARVNHYPCMNM